MFSPQSPNPNLNLQRQLPQVTLKKIYFSILPDASTWVSISHPFHVYGGVTGARTVSPEETEQCNVEAGPGARQWGYQSQCFYFLVALLWAAYLTSPYFSFLIWKMDSKITPNW